MPLYHTLEAGFEVPVGWIDGTVNALEYRRPEGLYRLLLARSPDEGRPLAALVDARLTDQRRQLPFFEVTRKAEGLTAGQPSVEIAATFREGEQLSYQRSLCFVLRPSFLVLAVNGPAALQAEMDAVFERAAATVRPRARGN